MTLIAGIKRDGLGAKIERLDPFASKADAAELMLHAHGGAVLLQIDERRLDQRRAQPLARNQRPAGAAAGGERLADDCRREPGRPLRRIDVQRCEKERFDQPMIEDTVTDDDLADGLACRRPQQPRQR